MSRDFRFFVAMLIWIVGASAGGIVLNQLWSNGWGAIMGVLYGGVIAILFYFFLPRSS